MTRFLLKPTALFLLISSQAAYPNQSHCSEDEVIYFNCLVERNKKLASVCAAFEDNYKRQELRYVQYRFGKLKNIEFEYPRSTDKQDQINRFHSTSGITRDHSLSTSEMSFKNGEWNYRLAYFEEEPDSKNPTKKSIIQVWKGNSRNGVKTIICANPDAGEGLHLDQVIGDLSTHDFKFWHSLW